MLLAPALSVSRGARGPGTGGGGWRRPRPWNGPGPAGLRGAQPPGRREGGTSRLASVSDALAVASGLSCPVSWPTRPRPRLVSTWCLQQSVCRQDAPRTQPNIHLPRELAGARTCPDRAATRPAPSWWPTPWGPGRLHTPSPPPPRSPRPPASNSCCPALGHAPPGDAAHALLAQNPQQLPPPRRAGPPLRARSAHTDGSTARGGGGCPGPRAPRTPARGDPGGLSGRPKSSTSPASFTGRTVTSCGPSVPQPRPSDGQGATREMRASRPCARNPAETENGGAGG